MKDQTLTISLYLSFSCQYMMLYFSTGSRDRVLLSSLVLLSVAQLTSLGRSSSTSQGSQGQAPPPVTEPLIRPQEVLQSKSMQTLSNVSMHDWIDGRLGEEADIEMKHLNMERLTIHHCSQAEGVSDRCSSFQTQYLPNSLQLVRSLLYPLRFKV